MAYGATASAGAAGNLTGTFTAGRDVTSVRSYGSIDASVTATGAYPDPAAARPGGNVNSVAARERVADGVTAAGAIGGVRAGGAVCCPM